MALGSKAGCHTVRFGIQFVFCQKMVASAFVQPDASDSCYLTPSSTRVIAPTCRASRPSPRRISIRLPPTNPHVPSSAILPLCPPLPQTVMCVTRAVMEGVALFLALSAAGTSPSPADLLTLPSLLSWLAVAAAAAAALAGSIGECRHTGAVPSHVLAPAASHVASFHSTATATPQ